MLKVFNPYSGELVCELEADEGEALEAKVNRAESASRAWRRASLGERMGLVRGGLEYFRSNAEAVARDITLQMGKPIRQAKREVEGLLERAEHMLEIAEVSLAPDVLPQQPGVVRRIEHVPHGVVLELAAWNYPLLIAVNVVVPALLAGNAVLLKHSARTPLCGKHFETAFGHMGPGHLVQNLILTHRDVAELIGDPRIGHVAFTGSVEGGHQVFAEASKRFLDTGLELGGKDPAYVAWDADLDLAAAGVASGACYNAGQSCCAVERVYVHTSRHDAFVERVHKELDRYRLGDPLKPATTMGPLASRGGLDVLERQVEDAVKRGARLLCGGRRGEGQFFPPTLLVDCPNSSSIMQEESFGPLVPVLRVADDDEAIGRMNDSRFGLTASVWTRDAERGERFAREVEAGTVYQNRCDHLDPAMPWTGWKDSGKGSTLSRYGFLDLTRRKSIYLRRAY
jgi:acyl-CoA reductase-like NAD-dependent aldehyde dehydrogenase